MSLLLLLRNHQSSGQPPAPAAVPYITVGAPPVPRRRLRSTGRIAGTSDLSATGHISFDSLADEDELLTII